MAIARRNIVDTETPGFYHCTNRCVRRTFLCGIDELSGRDFSHRKDKKDGTPIPFLLTIHLILNRKLSTKPFV